MHIQGDWAKEVAACKGKKVGDKCVWWDGGDTGMCYESDGEMHCVPP